MLFINDEDVVSVMKEMRYCFPMFISVALLLFGAITLNDNIISAFKPSKPDNARTPNPTATQTPNPTATQTPNPILDSSRDLRYYSNPSLGVTLQYPLDWSIQSLKGGVKIIKEKGITFVDIRLNKLKSSVSDLKQYVDDDIADRKKSRSGFKIIDNLFQTSISGNMPAYKTSYSFVKTEDPGKGMTEKLLRYWTLLSGKSYTIAYVSDLETFDKYRPVAEAIISSVHLGSEIQNPPNSQQLGSEIQESTTTQVRDINVDAAPVE
jgi:hypothetical protein